MDPSRSVLTRREKNEICQYRRGKIKLETDFIDRAKRTYEKELNQWATYSDLATAWQMCSNMGMMELYLDCVGWPAGTRVAYKNAQNSFWNTYLTTVGFASRSYEDVKTSFMSYFTNAEPSAYQNYYDTTNIASALYRDRCLTALKRITPPNHRLKTLKEENKEHEIIVKFYIKNQYDKKSLCAIIKDMLEKVQEPTMKSYEILSILNKEIIVQFEILAPNYELAKNILRKELGKIENKFITTYEVL